MTDRLKKCEDKDTRYAFIPLEVLRKLKATQTKALVKKFLIHLNSEVRHEAKKTVSYFDKLEKKT